jgi:hypothetical protein
LTCFVAITAAAEKWKALWKLGSFTHQGVLLFMALVTLVTAVSSHFAQYRMTVAIRGEHPELRQQLAKALNQNFIVFLLVQTLTWMIMDLAL